MCTIIMVDYILLALLDYFQPRESLGRARKFDLARWKKVRCILVSDRVRELTDSTRQICWGEIEAEQEADAQTAANGVADAHGTMRKAV